MNARTVALFRRISATVAVAVALLAPGTITAPSAVADVNVYTTPGEHTVNGRKWRTSCEPYTAPPRQIVRCRAEIWGTTVTYSGGRYSQSNGWKFNNLTYLPSPKSWWAGNPLASNGEFTSSGRQWKTSCADSWTGPNGCRSFIKTNVVTSHIDTSGQRRYTILRDQWVFNNVVTFTAGAAPAKPTPAKPTPKPAPSTPTPAPQQPTSGWPGANNTGVPAGVTLTAYTGPMTITRDNTVIRNAIVNGNLRIQAANVQIVNTRINGTVDLRDPRTNRYSFSIVDSEVHIGDNLNTGLMRGNFHANRVEITGGRRSAYCQYNCTIENSWVHSQGGDPGGNAHFSGIRMEQNTTLRHNTITCEAQRGSGTGCSAGLTGYGDFAPVQNNVIVNNYFHGGGGGGSTMCAYGGSSGDDGSKPYGHQAANIRFIDNVFARGTSGKCGNLGSIRSFNPNRPGNVWQGNTWDDGTPISHNGR